MPFILSAQRDETDNAGRAANWRNYVAYLDKNESGFPPAAFAIARSSWWYSFNDARAPHDSILQRFEMSDHWGSSDDDCYFSSIKITLGSGFGGMITLHYPKVFRYRLEREPDLSGVHGDWRYDEFSCGSEAGRFIHTIEWSDDATWEIEASELIHTYTPEEPNQ